MRILLEKNIFIIKCENVVKGVERDTKHVEI